MNKLEQLTSPLKNFRNMRNLYDSSLYPFVPPQSILSRDLFFIDQGNPTHSEENFINVDKFLLFGNIIFRIVVNAHVPFRYVRVDIIQQFLKSRPILTEEELDAISMEMES